VEAVSSPHLRRPKTPLFTLSSISTSLSVSTFTRMTLSTSYGPFPTFRPLIVSARSGK
jgi:hypothetical protein